MDAKLLIDNLIEAIESVGKAADESGDVSTAIEDAEDTAKLAKLILPSLEDPAPPVVIGEYAVYDEDTDQVVGPFPDEPTADAWILAQGMGRAVAYKMNRPGAPNPPSGPTAPFQPGDRVAYPTGPGLHRTAEFVRLKDATTAILKDQDEPGGFEELLSNLTHDTGGNPQARPAGGHTPFSETPPGGLYRN